MWLNPTKPQVPEVGWCMMVWYGMVGGGVVWYCMVGGGMSPIWKTAHNNQVYWPIKQMCCCRKLMKIFYTKYFCSTDETVWNCQSFSPSWLRQSAHVSVFDIKGPLTRQGFCKTFVGRFLNSGVNLAGWLAFCTQPAWTYRILFVAICLTAKAPIWVNLTFGPFMLSAAVACNWKSF